MYKTPSSKHPPAAAAATAKRKVVDRGKQARERAAKRTLGGNICNAFAIGSGQPVERTRGGVKELISGISFSPPAPESRRPCPHCPMTCVNEQGLGIHVRTQHSSANMSNGAQLRRLLRKDLERSVLSWEAAGPGRCWLVKVDDATGAASFVLQRKRFLDLDLDSDGFMDRKPKETRGAPKSRRYDFRFKAHAVNQMAIRLFRNLLQEPVRYRAPDESDVSAITTVVERESRVPKCGQLQPWERWNVDHVPLAFVNGLIDTWDKRGALRVAISQPFPGLEQRQCTMQIIFGPAVKKAAYHEDVDVLFQENAWADQKFCIDWAKRSYREGLMSRGGELPKARSILIMDYLNAQTTDEVQPVGAGAERFLKEGLDKPYTFANDEDNSEDEQGSENGSDEPEGRGEEDDGGRETVVEGANSSVEDDGEGHSPLYGYCVQVELDQSTRKTKLPLDKYSGDPDAAVGS
ncbi:unnamed protein product [Ectocarpus sp. CCAP 1310/34]|nr:unnamed protein product [Ectocarpus sp. CCAP 1310/34]